MNEPNLQVFTELVTVHVAHARGHGRPLPLARASDTAERCDEKLILPFDQRQKARQRARLCSGREIGIQLPRGTVLRGGDFLRSTDGALVEIIAAHEPVSTVRTRNLRELTRAAYHLGNRHVALEVGVGWIRYLEDHVLDAMIEQLGLVVVHENEAFEPEAGAYGEGPSPHVHHHGESPHLHHDDLHEHRVIFGGVRHGGQGHDQ